VKNRIPKLLSKIFMTKKMMLAFYFICVLYTITILYGNGFTFKHGCAENQYSSEYFLFKELPLVVKFHPNVSKAEFVNKIITNIIVEKSPTLRHNVRKWNRLFCNFTDFSNAAMLYTKT
jgi:hypothetical protein